MSIIVVNVKQRWTLTQTVKNLAKAIRGNFDVLSTINKAKSKMCYVRLSERLDPVLVIQNLNTKAHINAYIPKEVPDLPPEPRKRGRIPLRTRLALGIKVDETLFEVLKNAHKAIVEELQSKYTKLYSISLKTNHQLLESIAETVLERLKVILETNKEPQSGFELTMWYRRRHPHFGDFQLVLGALHALQDAAGAARSQLQEADLMVVKAQPFLIDNLPYDIVQSACQKYSDRITKKITDHINSLPCDEPQVASDEDKARAKVRKHIKDLQPYIPEIIRQVIQEQFVPKKSPFYRMRIYGEPALPRKEHLTPLMKKHNVVAIMRSDHIFNMLRFSVPARQYARMMALDGTTLSGVKLVVRTSDIPLYKPSPYILSQIKQITGEDPGTEDQALNEEEEYMDMDAEEGDEEVGEGEEGDM